MKFNLFSFTVHPTKSRTRIWFPRWIKGLFPELRKSLAFSHVNFSECFVEGKNLFRNDSEQYKKLVCADAADFQSSKTFAIRITLFVPHHHHHHSKHHSVHLHNCHCLNEEQNLESLSLSRHNLRCAFSCLENSPFSDPSRLCLAL